MLVNTLNVAALFAGEWIDSPGRGGAICPGSRWLAAWIAREVSAGDGLVVEQGAARAWWLQLFWQVAYPQTGERSPCEFFFFQRAMRVRS
jgi:hypothetical protein